ncbi:hypothetical protein TraAM80_04517 [Trypanosoma rangeli]|uniref:Uncharacterized protein n=1 Tax=Trypanosoma rangeli TaxID=5698 RepID=A0A422NJ55_TRYRA|nr:uncharacterized protein TraAM80_04517 [Trypanosoma rangeli]RNF05479.1 hypothetical protein TraAM80_04517 [Trypanosoma rangeli]|eukprot:RNF05479.1 hypothetical protein TraAM80_04517 [Trypanosoma rangeli]
MCRDSVIPKSFRLRNCICLVVRLLAEATANCQHCLASRGATELGGAAVALHLRCGVAVHDRHSIAARALHVHKVGVRALHQAAALVLHALGAHRRVAEIRVEESHCFFVTSPHTLIFLRKERRRY